MYIACCCLLAAAAAAAADATASDHEQDPIKLSSLSPGRVDLDGVAVQIACGLQHTGTSVCLSVSLSLCLSVSLSVCLSVCLYDCGYVRTMVSEHFHI